MIQDYGILGWFIDRGLSGNVYGGVLHVSGSGE